MRASSPEAVSAPGARQAATLLAFLFFCWWPQPSGLPLVVGAASGGFLLWHAWLSPRIPRTDARGPLGRLRAAMADIAASQQARRLQRSFVKALVGKVAKGEIDPEGFQHQRLRADRLVEQRDRMASRRRLVVARSLNGGSGGDAWRRGARGAALASILASPWMILQLGDIGFMGYSNAQAAARLCALALDFARWPALGFVLMYVYPVIKGSYGMQKGLRTALLLVVPRVVATAFASELTADVWRGVLMESLQVFITCMVLTVALGDVGALRKAGIKAVALVELYDLGALAAWSSSLVLAVGVAATTTLAGATAPILNAGLKMFVPALAAGQADERGHREHARAAAGAASGAGEE